MYGTRDAAFNWETTYREFLEDCGFKTGRASPCVLWIEARDTRVVVHGDDFTVLGFKDDLDWFRGEIQKKFEVKLRGRLGPEEGYEKSVSILNRVVEWGEDGITYEADQRHAEIIKKDFWG
jgi:hypothetical protein